MHLIKSSFKLITISILTLILVSCATVLNEREIDLKVSFNDGITGSCYFKNKRSEKEVSIPGSFKIRRSDDPLKYECSTDDGRTVNGAIESLVEKKKFIPSFLLDLGISDMITDKHRYYPENNIIKIDE